MENAPAIGIIIPVFGNATTIECALNSVTVASRRSEIPVEIVVVFDGPDTASHAVVSELVSRSQISITVIHIPHSGIGSARNAGVAATTAPLITFLDADDEITASRLTYGIQVADDEVLIGHQIVHESAPLPGLHSATSTLPSIPYITSMVLHRATFQSLGGFDPTFTLGDDWDFVVRVREAGLRVTIIDEVGTVRHIDDANASHDTRRLAADYMRAIRAHVRERKRI